MLGYESQDKRILLHVYMYINIIFILEKVSQHNDVFFGKLFQRIYGTINSVNSDVWVWILNYLTKREAALENHEYRH